MRRLLLRALLLVILPATDAQTGNSSASRTTIRDLINAPKTYKSQVTDDTSKLVVNTDAAVEIPDVEKDFCNFCYTSCGHSRIFLMVSQMPFSQMRRFTPQTAIIYRQRMRSRKKIDELKEDVANGNLDPNNWGTDDNGNLIYDIYDDIDYWENQYESAPETRNLVEGRPAVGVQTYSNTGEVMEDNAFYRCSPVR